MDGLVTNTIPDVQQNTLGTIAYEITNYLGNVNVVISDRKLWTPATNAFKACIVSRTDYFPFGMEISSRTTNSDNYRFGYNGMESDDETKGSGNSYTTEFRQYDPRIGRWLSLDPLMAQFPWQSPYCAFDNNPIVNVDPLGLYSEKRANKKAERMERKGYENVSVVQSGDKEGNKTGNYGVSTTGKKDGSGYGHYFGNNDKKSGTNKETVKPREPTIWYTNTKHSMAEAPLDKMVPGDVIKQSLYDPYGVDYTNGILPDYREYKYLGDGQFVLTKRFKNEETADLVVEGAMYVIPIGRAFKVVGAGIKLMRLGKGLSVIGARGTYREFAKKIGANYLKVTDASWTWEKNLKYLQGIVKRGDDVIFAGTFNPAKLVKTSVLAKEIKFLEDNGYK